ncbi:MAG: TrmH family RNA methyltransferase [Bacteroidia bacterium]
MLSKAEVKIIASLKLKKHQQETGLFVAEGEKTVTEALALGWEPEFLVLRDDARDQLIESEFFKHAKRVKPADMDRMSQLSTASSVLAVFRQKKMEINDFPGGKSYVLGLEGIKDPGNLGTIIRIADWFGLAGLYCSPDTVSHWNAKCVQSSMGSVFRMAVVYTHLEDLVLQEGRERIYATVLGGADIRKHKFGEGGIVLIGSESFGLSEGLRKAAGWHISIPAFGGAESLNAAVATGIVCSWLRA